jgi:hypothetical protein
LTATDPKLRALHKEIAEAPDAHIVRIVATVDAMASRGPADALIAPLRLRLGTLRPPRPLRFARLMFHPLDPLIVPAARWRPGQNAIPRTALAPIADHVRQAMGERATAIEGRLAGHTTADLDLIAACGSQVWPAVPQVLSDGKVPDAWETTGLGPAIYPPLASAIAVLLGQAAALEALATATAHGLLPPNPQRIEAMLAAVTATHLPALPMMVALLLARVPEAASVLPTAHSGATGAAVQAALGQAAGRLLQQLDEDDGAEVRIGSGSLGDAGASAGRIAALLGQLDAASANPRQRLRIQAIRKKLDASCKARFGAGLELELLIPLNQAEPAAMHALETAARGLRVLETEGRQMGSGATYDLLLHKAAEAIGSPAMRERLARVDQVRLVEILSGPDAALAILE